MIKQAILTGVILSLLSLCLWGCTCSINLVHTEGSASDLIDEIDSMTPDVDIKMPFGAKL